MTLFLLNLNSILGLWDLRIHLHSYCILLHVYWFSPNFPSYSFISPYTYIRILLYKKRTWDLYENVGNTQYFLFLALSDISNCEKMRAILKINMLGILGILGIMGTFWKVPLYGVNCPPLHYGRFRENLSQNSRGYIFSLFWHCLIPLALWDIENLLKTKKRPTKAIKAISKATGLEYENLIIFSCFWDLLVSSNWWFQYFRVSRPKRPKRPHW